MADDSDDGPAVEVGEAEPVEGAPVARVASRLTWGIEYSEVVRREGDTVVRTPDGPRQLAAILEDVEETYFETSQDFEAAVREVTGHAPVPVDTEG